MTSKAAAEFLDALASAGWNVKTHTEPVQLLPPALRQRYPNVPPEVVSFLERVAECTDPSDQVWVFSPEQYAYVEGPGFRWNECELISLEAAEADGDETLASKIQEFWNLHFPFMMAVHSDYEYMAICLAPPEYGRVVHGRAPEFEEAVTAANTFEEFLTTYALVIREGRTRGPHLCLPIAKAR